MQIFCYPIRKRSKGCLEIATIIYVSARHKEQERRMETIIRESSPIDLGDEVVKCKLKMFN